MLQIIITPSDKYSMAEMAQMAIEAGAQWRQLRVPEMSDEELRESSADIITLCRESGTMLTIEDRVDMARELGLHGVFLHAGENSPLKVREELGAEAVIGTMTGSPDSAMAMERADIDYVALPGEVSEASEFIGTIRSAGSQIPVVAYRPYSSLGKEEIATIMAQGFSGICGGASVFNSDNPVGAIEEALANLLNKR